MTERSLGVINSRNRLCTIDRWMGRQASTFDPIGEYSGPENQPMRISIGSDHAGFLLKEAVKAHLQQRGVELLDRGTNSGSSVDYPDHAHAVARDVATGLVGSGIVLCGSANGVNITANKHHGVRSAIAWNAEVARLAREHNDANVLALPARYLGTSEALGIVDAFLDAHFEGGRHQRRVEKIEIPA